MHELGAEGGHLPALADRCGPDGRSAWPTVETLSLEAHCSESSVRRALKALEQCGTIRRGDQRLAQWDENRLSAQGVPVGRVGVLHGSSTRTRGAKPGRQARAEREARGLRVDQNPRKQGCHNDISRKPQESNESETCQNDTPTRVNPASEDSRPVIGDRSEVSPVTGLYKKQINKQIPFSPYGAFPPKSSATTNTPSADGGPISEPCEETGKPVNHAEDSADDALDALADARTGLGLEAPKATPADRKAVANLLDRLAANGSESPMALVLEAIAYLSERDFWLRQVMAGRDLAKRFDRIRNDMLVDQACPARRRVSDTSEPAEPDIPAQPWIPKPVEAKAAPVPVCRHHGSCEHVKAALAG